MSIDECLSYLTISKEIPILLKTEESAIVAAFPVIISAIISFVAVMFAAYIGHKTSTDVFNRDQNLRLTELRLNKVSEISEKLSKIQSLSDLSTMQAGNMQKAIGIYNHLKIELLASEDSKELIDHLEKLNSIKDTENEVWRQSFLDLSCEYINKLKLSAS